MEGYELNLLIRYLADMTGGEWLRVTWKHCLSFVTLEQLSRSISCLSRPETSGHTYQYLLLRCCVQLAAKQRAQSPNRGVCWSSEQTPFGWVYNPSRGVKQVHQIISSAVDEVMAWIVASERILGLILSPGLVIQQDAYQYFNTVQLRFYCENVLEYLCILMIEIPKQSYGMPREDQQRRLDYCKPAQKPTNKATVKELFLPLQSCDLVMLKSQDYLQRSDSSIYIITQVFWLGSSQSVMTTAASSQMRATAPSLDSTYLRFIIESRSQSNPLRERTCSRRQNQSSTFSLTFLVDLTRCYFQDIHQFRVSWAKSCNFVAGRQVDIHNPNKHRTFTLSIHGSGHFATRRGSNDGEADSAQAQQLQVYQFLPLAAVVGCLLPFLPHTHLRFGSHTSTIAPQRIACCTSHNLQRDTMGITGSPVYVPKKEKRAFEVCRDPPSTPRWQKTLAKTLVTPDGGKSGVSIAPRAPRRVKTRTCLQGQTWRTTALLSPIKEGGLVGGSAPHRWRQGGTSSRRSFSAPGYLARRYRRSGELRHSHTHGQLGSLFLTTIKYRWNAAVIAVIQSRSLANHTLYFIGRQGQFHCLRDTIASSIPTSRRETMLMVKVPRAFQSEAKTSHVRQMSDVTNHGVSVPWSAVSKSIALSLSPYAGPWIDSSLRIGESTPVSWSQKSIGAKLELRLVRQDCDWKTERLGSESSS
nr:hypothetical protein CFP56_64019 [Quercus suber]